MEYMSDGDAYEKAKAVVIDKQKALISVVQRHAKIGYNQAARAIERMESEGVVSPINSDGKREVYLNKPIKPIDEE